MNYLAKDIFKAIQTFIKGFPGSSEVKASACNAGDPGLIPGLGTKCPLSTP